MTPFRPKPIDVAVTERAGAQHGLVRRADLEELGVTRDQLRQRLLAHRLLRLHPGVYAVGHTALSRHARFLAATWWIGGVLSHESAAAFYGWIVEDADDPPAIHVSTTRDRRGEAGVVEVHRTRHLDHRDVMRYGQLPVTDRVRTLVDLADHLGYAELRAVADELPALPKARLTATAKRLPGRAGAGRTQRLIHSADATARFALERRSVAYFAAHGVPGPARNVRVHGVLVDCWYPDARLVVELDSRAHHSRETEMEADRLRDRALKRHGVSTLRLMWHDLDPENPLAAQDVLRELGRGPERGR